MLNLESNGHALLPISIAQGTSLTRDRMTTPRPSALVTHHPGDVVSALRRVEESNTVHVEPRIAAVSSVHVPGGSGDIKMKDVHVG